MKFFPGLGGRLLQTELACRAEFSDEGGEHDLPSALDPQAELLQRCSMRSARRCCYTTRRQLRGAPAAPQTPQCHSHLITNSLSPVLMGGGFPGTKRVNGDEEK